jgi:hypothetical protein
MADQQIISDVKKLVDDILAVNIEQLIQNPKWGELNFEDCRSSFDIALSVIGPLPSYKLEYLIEEQLTITSNALQAFTAAINSIGKFSISEGQPADNRNSLAAQLIGSSQDVWRAIAPWIGYLHVQSSDIGKNMSEISNSRRKLEEMVKNIEVDTQTAKNKIDEAVSVSKQAAGRTGVDAYTSDFGKAAAAAGKTAGRWLCATIVLVVLMIAVAGYFGLTEELPTSKVQLAQFAVTRLFLLALLFTAMIWCSKQYRTNKHEESVSRHRANALNTFQTFISAAEDAPTRDAVLLETTRSIFAISPSGYLGDSDSTSAGPSSVIEVFKAGTPNTQS